MFFFEQVASFILGMRLDRTEGGDALGNGNADKAAVYTAYAECCVKTAKTLRDREDRSLQREMAAEWLRLAQLIAEDVAQTARSSPKARKTSRD
jgi:hypothetical protein